MPKKLLRATEGQTETCNDLVEDQHNTEPAAQLTQRFEITRSGRQAATIAQHRLWHDEASNVVRMLLQQPWRTQPGSFPWKHDDIIQHRWRLPS